MTSLQKKRLFSITKIQLALLLVMPLYQNCGGFKPTELSETSSSSFLSTGGLQNKSAYGKIGLRRLTSYEVVNSVTDVFGVSAQSFATSLPSDEYQTTHFSNESGAQAIAPVTIESYQSFSEAYSNYYVSQADFSTRFAQQAGCTPTGFADRTCLIQFITKIGGKIMRQPVAQADAERWADAFIPLASSEKNFKTAVELSIQAWLQNPEFLYRLENGGGSFIEPNVVELSDYEIASALSYLIVGSTPDDALLDKARRGLLKDPSARVAEAERLFASVKARPQWQRFHAQWLGYENAILPQALDSDMHQESNMLVNRIVFEKQGDWLDLFRSDESYLTPALATQYGMAGVTSAGWTKYSGQRGGGILAHATFLSQGAKFGDTSPTRRGYEIFKRVMCGKLGPIPDSIDTDRAPGNPGDCKPVRYNMRQITACNGCHNVTDNIGFGLENFGVAGEWRTTEPGKPNCAVDNAGSVDGVSYSGPAALGNLLASQGATSQCAVTELFRFYAGRTDTTDDQSMLTGLNTEYLMGRSLKSVLVAMVRSPGFINRVK